MKINDALARIDAGWVRKPKGFRVRFDVYVDGRWQADCSPEENTAPLDSDVTAWRLAWKLAQAGRPDTARAGAGFPEMAAIHADRRSRTRWHSPAAA